MATRVFFCVLVTIASGDTAYAGVICDAGLWQLNHIAGTTCYRLVLPSNQYATWCDAQNECAVMGEILAQIRTETEFTFIVNMTKKSTLFDYGQVWIDGNNVSGKGYHYIDDSPFVLDHWHSGEPSRSSDNEHCLALMRKDNDYKLNDQRCDSHMA